MLGLKPIGALAWRPDTLSREVATAIGAQVAIALTRALAIENITRAWKQLAKENGCARR